MTVGERRDGIASRPIYRGAWAVLVRAFRVPEEPPSVPGTAGADARVLRPSPGFLRSLKLSLGFVLSLVGLAALVVPALLLASSPAAAAAALLLVLLLLGGAAAIGWVAIHLRYDTTWYVLTERAVRTRRGIWTIRETTLTFENVQNVRVSQGPVQRWCGISDLVLETAGSAVPSGKKGHEAGGAQRTVLEGISAPQRVRDLVLERVRRSRSAGLGDADDRRAGGSARPGDGRRGGWTEAHLEVLAEIRDAAAALRAGSA